VNTLYSLNEPKQIQMIKNIGITILFILLLSVSTKATTWKKVIRECPVCHYESTYNVISSYGSYIYDWPSKYQFIYWPYTDKYYFYSCPNCHFSAYSSDFKNISKKKIAEVQDLLNVFSFDKGTTYYMEIPIGMRLEIAGLVYKILGRSEEFWCHYYRVCAYHSDADGQHEIATDYRIKAIRTAQSMLSKSLYSGRDKELLMIMAAMYNYTDQTDSALICLEKAKPLVYKNRKEKHESNYDKNNYLNELIPQFEEFIKTDGKDSIEP
jgi:uncharacterized protein (DUF2225 family)